MRVVVSDTSPVRALAHLGRLDLLTVLFDEILVPPAVAHELRNPKGGVVSVEPASIPGIRVTDAPDQRLVEDLLGELDPGEAEAIALAIQLRVDVILIDERDGNEVARRRGLTPIGVLGLLLRGKSAGVVRQVAPLVQRLRLELKFHMSDGLQATVLRLAGE